MVKVFRQEWRADKCSANRDRIMATLEFKIQDVTPDSVASPKHVVRPVMEKKSRTLEVCQPQVGERLSRAADE